MNKRGFTLIEIIICLVLIVGIGTASIFGIRTVNNNITRRELTEIEDKIYEAVNIYIETKAESKKQLYENNNGVIIPLNVLQNEGLMEFKNIDIKDHYVVSLLGGGTPGDACLGVTEIGSWTDKNKTIFLCLNTEIKTYITENIGDILNGRYITKDEYDLKISNIEERLYKLEKIHGTDLKKKLINIDGSYVAKGQNPNNWVEFDVTHKDNQWASWPSEDTDLWRIIDISNDGRMRLIYNKPVDIDNSKALGTVSTKVGSRNYYSLNQEPEWYSPCYSVSPPISYSDSNIWVGFEIYGSETTAGTKKNLLYTTINDTYKKMIIPSTYMQKLNSDKTYRNLYFSTISSQDLNLSYIGGNSWLYAYEQIIGDNKQGKYLVCPGYGDYKIKIVDVNNKNIIEEEGLSYQSAASGYLLYGSNYIPVITLNSKVNLLDNKTDSCTGGKIQGTKECPYRLECSEC